MNGIELMEICKKHEDAGCINCPKQRECKKWREDAKTVEPWELMKLVDEKEY